MDVLNYIVAFVIAICVLVVVHEFGHFWVAKRLGVKVLRFSIGFGKPLWIKKIGKDKMELAIAPIPLGGYVRMLGENEDDVPARERHRAFSRQPVWKRIAIVVAGPAFNFLFAILAYWLIFSVGIGGLKPVVAHVVDDSPAAHAGFRAGDEILAVDGKDVLTWDHRRLYLFGRALDQATVTFDVRDAQGVQQTRVVDLSEFPASAVNAGLVEYGIGISNVPPLAPVIGDLEEGPAKRAGLQPGDRILSIDGTEVATWNEMVAIISAAPEKLLRLEVQRGDKRLQFYVKPDSVKQGETIIGRIQARPQVPKLPEEMRTTMRLSPVAALGEAVANTWNMSWLTLEMLYRMLRLEVSADTISGPLTIAQFAGASAKIGIDYFIVFLAVISISLGVLNLLPIPILDGGHLLYYLIEIVKGGPVPEKVLVAGQRIGIVLLVMLMTLALYNDITRIFR